MSHHILPVLFSLLLIVGKAQALECQLQSLPNLAFGVYDPLASLALESDTMVQIDCQATMAGEQAAFRIKLIGAISGGALRVLQGTDGGEQLIFSLYRDARRSIALADDSWIAINETVVGHKVFTIPIYGQIFAGQHRASAGSYSASILLSLEY